jgi:hypothetical protein
MTFTVQAESLAGTQTAWETRAQSFDPAIPLASFGSLSELLLCSIEIFPLIWLKAHALQTPSPIKGEKSEDI